MRSIVTAVLIVLVSLAASPLASAQVVVRYSRQGDEILRAYVGVVPKDIALYSAQACNTGMGEARFFPDRVMFEAAAIAPVEDAAAAVFAAQSHKSKNWAAVAMNVGIAAIPYLGSGVSIANALGASGIGGRWSTLGTSAALLVPKLQAAHDQITQLTVPTNWLTPGLPEVVLPAGGCAKPWLMALGSSGGERFERTVLVEQVGQPALSPPPPITGETAPATPGGILSPQYCYPDANGDAICRLLTASVVYRNDGTVDAVATILAARQAEAAASSSVWAQYRKGHP